MSEKEFLPYRLQSYLKASMDLNENGIGLFETESLRGLIRLGASTEPERLLAEVYCRDQPVRQVIDVSSDSSRHSRERLFTLLATYRFTSGLPRRGQGLEDVTRHVPKGTAKFISRGNE
jgi:hypothetical protein